MNIENLDIVFLGCVYPDNLMDIIHKYSIGQIDYAANNLQWKIIDGIEKNISKPIKIINSINIGSYPFRYKKAVIATQHFSHAFGIEDVSAGFFNFTVLKQVSKIITIMPHLYKWAYEKNGKIKILIVYSMTVVMMECITLLKKKYNHVVIVVIVPDLPQYTNTSNKINILYKIFKLLSLKRNKIHYNNIDAFVLLTEKMADVLPVSSDNFVVVEGIANEYCVPLRNSTSDLKTITYTGTMNQRYGILNLIAAFTIINK